MKDIDTLWGTHKEQVILDCFSSPFPGTKKWEKENPIWDCNVYNKKSPKEGWKDINIIEKAVNNLYWIVNKSLYGKRKDLNFVNRVFNAFTQAYKYNHKEKLLNEVLNRFTIAKIAPKVTALRPSVFKDIIEQSKIDISNGVYCPMSGFGGIIQGAKSWYDEHNISYNNLIEAYDINKKLCSYYGWEYKDALKEVVYTDKVVIACPPFGKKTERWDGTPEIREDDYKTNYLDFSDWCVLLKKFIKAPNYIFIGPEKTDKFKSKYKSGCKTSGLFIKKMGVAWYPEYSELSSMGEE